MKYEFHVGDYVETKSGIKGYISDIDVRPDYFSWIVTESKGVKEAASPGSLTYCTDLTLYKRIGQYISFGKATDDSGIKEIERMKEVEEENIWNERSGGWLYAQQKKINELVDAVNELRKAK